MGLMAASDERWSMFRLVLVIFLAVGPLLSMAEEPGVVDAVSDQALLEDWIRQDHGPETGACFSGDRSAELENRMLGRVFDELGGGGAEYRIRCRELLTAKVPPTDPRWLALYVEACRARRELRLETLRTAYPTIVFTKHYNLGGSHYAYTEGQSDAQAERHFQPGAALCLLELDAAGGRIRTLVDDPEGVIRDPDVSYDGRRVLFAWKKSDFLDDYHLYELEVESGEVHQLTFGLGVADYEGVYMPDGDVLFNSTRCVQIVDCWWTEVSNLYRCGPGGDHLRRVTFDQVHTNYPQVLEDGRVIYTRWDYSDRGQIYPQPLFQMNSDGTNQREFYGNNSWFPTTILHARGIPGSRKLAAVLSGHHSHQRGKLAIIDPDRGSQEASGVQLIAPVRPTKAERIDAYGQDGEQFQYPYPVSETEFLVTYSPVGGGNRQYPRPYGIYWIDAQGHRELLARDDRISVNQPVPLAARPTPHLKPSAVDYTRKSGTYYMQDVYAGSGLEGIPCGTVKRIRVVGLEFRAAGIGHNYSSGPGGGALSSTPVSIGNGCWDVKVVLGDATVHQDGSACFEVPAQTPVYFQALDERGCAVQTMRTWSTLQPGEMLSCVGCHETKNEAGVYGRHHSMALEAGPERLRPFYGPARGFSFVKEIQPILDRHCVECHRDRTKLWPADDPKREIVDPGFVAGPEDAETSETSAFSLLGTPTAEKRSKRAWSDAYLALTAATKTEPAGWNALKGQPNELVNWIGTQSVPELLPPYFQGAATSRLMKLLEESHYEVRLSREELEKIACWIDLLVPYCGDYTEAAVWSPDERAKYAHFLAKRRRIEAAERRNVEALLRADSDAEEETGRSNGSTYRNLALNPLDRQGDADGYPHASSNSEYEGKAWFAAPSAIDGRTANQGHGPRYPSWGPHKRTDLWWKVDFGREVTVDKLVLYIRADFPHDAHWHSATVEFSDGSKEKIEIAKTAGRQAFTFDRRATRWVRLTDLVQTEPLGWCAFTEVEVWGRRTGELSEDQ